MRNTFIETLTSKAKLNKKIVLIIGDLGYNVVEKFRDNFPDRFYNAGIAEQNMASMAAGLASQGFHVFVYSIANFPTFRCAEQIRNDICYHNLNVTIVTVGGGLSYGSLGYSHHAIQDLGLMRLFPEMTILSPGDPSQTKLCLDYILENPSPSYLRLKKSGEEDLTKNITKISDGEWIEIIKPKQKDIFLTVSGGLPYAFKAIKNKKYKNFGIYSCPVWSHKSKKIQSDYLNQFDKIITIEDHLIDCGFGSWIRESIFDNELHKKIKTIGLSNEIIGKVGDENYLNKLGGLETFEI
jgi:transketolase